MAYKALGWTVWRVIRLYVRRRFGGLVTRRRALVAGGVVAAASMTAAGVPAVQQERGAGRSRTKCPPGGLPSRAVQPSFPPDSAPLEVDRVEWVPASPEAVHVHLLGRWVDRPVADPLVLLVGTERRRHAFDALDTPPPGVLAAFAVPNELRSRLSVDIALQIGANEMALPGAGTGTLRDEAALEDEEG